MDGLGCLIGWMSNTMMKIKDNFAVFILTHGRADHVATYKALHRHGYTGEIYFLVDNTDDQIDQYKKNYGDQVIVFDKQKAIDQTDCFEKFGLYKAIVFARNYSFVIAKELGLKYFVELDDDYTNFWYTIDNNGKYLTAHKPIKDLNKTFNAVIDFLSVSNAAAVCFSQSGDFIGGPNSTMAKCGSAGKWHRKAMNSFFLCVDRPFKFRGVHNEDVSTYTSLGNIGKRFFTIPRLRLKQGASQVNKGGMSELYLETGTYVKSFYTVMCAPSCVSIALMGVKNMRLHHRISWKHAVPQIISEDVKVLSG